MSHVIERLKLRFGISDLTVPKLKYFTMEFGEKLFEDKGGAEFYKVTYAGKSIYPVVRDGRIVTVYWSTYVDLLATRLFRHKPKKLTKIHEKMRG